MGRRNNEAGAGKISSGRPRNVVWGYRLAIVVVMVEVVGAFPPFVLQECLAAEIRFACLALAELFALATIVASIDIRRSVRRLSDLDTDCEVLRLGCGGVYGQKCACCEAGHHYLCNHSFYVCDCHNGLLTTLNGTRVGAVVFPATSTRGRVEEADLALRGKTRRRD
jgi:hypothetical protein